MTNALHKVIWFYELRNLDVEPSHHQNLRVKFQNDTIYGTYHSRVPAGSVGTAVLLEFFCRYFPDCVYCVDCRYCKILGSLSTVCWKKFKQNYKKHQHDLQPARSMPQRFRLYFARNPTLNGIESQTSSLANLARNGVSWPSYLGGGFYAHQCCT